MKLKFSLVALLMGAWLTTAQADDAPASIFTTNPDFENGMGGWSVTDSDAMAKLSQILPEAAHTGKLGLRVQQAAGQSGSWIASAPMPVTPQQTYRISFWVRTTIDSHAAVYFRFMGAVGSNWVDPTKPSAGMFQIPGDIYDWRECEFQVQAPAGAVTALIAVHAYNQGACEADFDDFLVTPVTP